MIPCFHFVENSDSSVLCLFFSVFFSQMGKYDMFPIPLEIKGKHVAVLSGTYLAIYSQIETATFHSSEYISRRVTSFNCTWRWSTMFLLLYFNFKHNNGLI